MYNQHKIINQSPATDSVHITDLTTVRLGRVCLTCGVVCWVNAAGVGPMTLSCSQQMLGLLPETEVDEEINQALTCSQHESMEA